MPVVQPYASRHVRLNGPGDERPTAQEVVLDQNLKGALNGTVILITGATSGIGFETARVLYLTGAKIYITARDATKGDQAASELTTDPTRPVKVVEMSLDSFKSIRAGAAKFLEAESKLNILIHNAGIMACPDSRTIDGHETQFGTNHLGHFLLFQLLKPALLTAATPERPSRAIALSSSAHRFADGLPFDDLDFSKSEYSPVLAYGRSKLANIWFANEVDRRYGSQNLHALSVHPGSIKTPLQRHLKDTEYYKQATSHPAYQAQLKSVEQGAATTVWAAIGKEWKNRGGVYLENVGEAEPLQPGEHSFRPGYSEASRNPKDEKRLWEISNQLCGIVEE